MSDNKTDAKGNDEVHALQQELLQCKHDNEHLRTSLKDKTNTLNATILKKAQQIHQQEAKLKQEIEQYSKTKAIYQSIIDEHKSLKTQIISLQNQLTQHQNHVEQKTVAMHDTLRAFEHKENKYKDMIAKYRSDTHKLKQQMTEMQNAHQNDTKQLHDAHQSQLQQCRTSANTENDFISLVVSRMSEQTEKRDKTYLMASDLNDITFTELQARFSELMLAFQKEYHSHKIASSQIKQLQCEKELKHVEMESMKAQLTNASNNYHNTRLKCNQYEAIYGDMNSVDHDTFNTILSLQNQLKERVNKSNEYKQQIQSLLNEKEMQIKQQRSQQTAQISTDNNMLRDKIHHLEDNIKDRDESLTRYKTMNQQLSNVLAKLRQHKTETIAKDTKDGDVSKEEESELELCQRMYRDEVIQLQQTMDECNKERSETQGENAKLTHHHNDLNQQIRNLNGSKAYLSDIIKKQKLKCSNLSSNISEQQAYIQTLHSKYTEINDEYLKLNTKYTEIQIKHDVLQQNKENNNRENLNYRIQYAELKKLIASLKNESKAYKQQYTQINIKYKTLATLNRTTEDRLHMFQKEDLDKHKVLNENETLKHTILGLKETISRNECEINNLSKQLVISQKNEALIPNLKSEIEQLNEQINELKVNIAILEQNETSYTYDHMEQDDNVSVQSNKSTTSTIATPNKLEYKQRLKELRQIAVKSQLETERLTHQLNEYQLYNTAKTREWTQKLQQYENKLRLLQNTESKQSAAIIEWKERHTKAQARYERELKNHARSLQQMKTLRQQITASQESTINTTIFTKDNETKQDLHCAVLEAELIACNSTVDRFKNENQIISSELITIKEELRKQQSTCNDNQCKSRSVSCDTMCPIVSVETFNSLQLKYNETLKKLEHITHKMQVLDTEHKQCNRRYNVLQNEHKTLTEQMKRVMKDNESLKERNISYLSTYPQIDPDEFENVKQELILLTQQLKESTQEHDQSKTEEKRYHSICDKLRNECNQYKTQITAEQSRCKELSALMRSTLDSVDQTKTQNAIQRETFNKKIKAKDEQLTKLQSDVDKSKELIGKMKKLLANKTNNINAKQQHIDTLNKQNKSKMEEVHTVKASLHKAVEAEKILKSEILNKTKQFEDKQKEHKMNTAAQKEAHKADIAALNDSRKCLMEQVEQEKKAKSEISKLMTTILESHDKEMKKKQQEMDTLQKECNKAKELMNKMKNVMASKKLRVDKLQNEYNETNRVMEHLREENKKLKEMRSTLQANIKLQTDKLGEVTHEKEQSLESKHKQHEKDEKELELKRKKIAALNTELANMKKKYQTLSADATKYLNLSIECKTNEEKMAKAVEEKNKCIESLKTQLLSAHKTMDDEKKAMVLKETELKEMDVKLHKMKKEYTKVYNVVLKTRAENKELITRLKDSASVLEKTKKELQQKTEAIQSMILILNKYKTEQKELQQTIEQQTQQITKLQQEVKKRKNDMEIYSKAMNKQEQSMNSLINEMKKDQEVERSPEETEDMSHMTYEENMEKLRQLLDEKQKEIQDMKQVVANKEKIVNTKQQAIDAYKTQITAEQSRYKELSALMQSTLDSVDKTKAHHAIQRETFNKKIKAKDEQLTKLQNDIDKSKELMGKMKKLLANKTNNINTKQQHIDTLIKQNKGKMDEMNALKASLQKAIEAEKTLKSDILNKTKQFEDKQKAQQEAHTSDIVALEGDMKQIVAKKTSIINTEQQEIDTLKKQNKSKMDEIKTLKASLQKAIEAAKTLKSEILNKTKQLNDKQKEHEMNTAAQQEAHQADIAALNEDMKQIVAKKTSIIKTKQQEIDTLKKHNKSNTDEINILKASLQKAEESEKSLKLDILNKTKQLNDKQKEYDTNTAAQEAHKADIAALKENQKRLMEQVTKKETNVKELQDENDKLQHQFEECIQTDRQNTENIRALLEQEEKKKIKCEKQHQEKLEKLRQTLEKKQQEIEDMTQGIATKEANMKELQQTNDILTNEIAEYLKEKTQMKDYLTAMEQNLETMKEDKSKLETEQKDAEISHTKEVELLQTKLNEESVKYKNVYELAGKYQNDKKILNDKVNKLELQKNSLSLQIKTITNTLSQTESEFEGLRNTLNNTQNAETKITQQNKSLQIQIKQLETGLVDIKKEFSDKEQAIKQLQTKLSNLLQQHSNKLATVKAEHKKLVRSLEAKIAELKQNRTDKQLRKLYDEATKTSVEAKKMLMKEKKLRNELEKTNQMQTEMMSYQEKEIGKLRKRGRKSSSKSPSKTPRRSISSASKSPQSSLSNLPSATTINRRKRKLDTITLDSDSDEDDDCADVPPKKRHKQMDSDSSQVIDLTSTESPLSKPKKSSLESLSVDSKSSSKSVNEMNALLKKKLQKLQQKPSREPRSWCHLSLDFSENNSLDPESVDSSFPVFDVYFNPVNKPCISWKKPFVDILRVRGRLSYEKFIKQTNINEWLKKDKKEIPKHIGLFKCEHEATPNKTKVNNFIQVNKLLADKKCVGFAEYRSEYKMYFIPSSSHFAAILNEQYQKQMEVIKDRMWVIWLKK